MWLEKNDHPFLLHPYTPPLSASGDAPNTCLNPCRLRAGFVQYNAERACKSHDSEGLTLSPGAKAGFRR